MSDGGRTSQIDGWPARRQANWPRGGGTVVVEVDVELLVLVVVDVLLLVVVLVLLVVVLVLVVVVLVLDVVGVVVVVVDVVLVDVDTEVVVRAGASVADEAELVWTAHPAARRTRVMIASVTRIARWSATSGRHATPTVCQRPSSCSRQSRQEGSAPNGSRRGSSGRSLCRSRGRLPTASANSCCGIRSTTTNNRD